MSHSVSVSTLQSRIAEYRRRPATPEERRFLRRYNLVRLWRMALFWLLPLFLLGLIAMLHWLLAGMAMDGVWQAAALLAAPLLFLDWVYLRQWGGPLLEAVRMRPFLRVPDDLQVLEFEAPLGLLIHRTDHEANVFMAGPVLIDVPQHWEDEVLRRAGARARQSRFAVASLPGTQGKVIRLPMNRLNLPSLKMDLLLRDIGDIVIGLDRLSIQEEMQARLPVLRGHPGMLFIALTLGLAAGLSAMLWDQGADKASRQQQEVRRNLASLTSRYLDGTRVDITELQARGFEALAYMPDTREQVVTGASFERMLVAQSRQDAPFFLSQAEWNAIQRASFVFPRDLPGSSPARPEMIEDYRRMLLDRLAGDDAERLRLHAVVRDLPDALVERQLRALSMGNRPEPAFVDALLPSPAVHPGEEGAAYPAGAMCGEGEALCRAGMRATVSWEQPAFIAGAEGSIGVVHASEVARIFALRDELSSIQQAPRGEMAKGWAAALGAMALICALMYWHASRVLKRYWRKDGARP